LFHPATESKGYIKRVENSLRDVHGELFISPKAEKEERKEVE